MLRRKAQQCDYGDQLESQIRHQVISKCRSSGLRKRFLEKGHMLNLKQLQEIARTSEAVKKQTKSMCGPSEGVNRISENTGRQSRRESKSEKSGKIKNSDECFRCGKPGHFARDPRCPARGKECSKCHQKGHFAVVCKTKSKDLGKLRVSFVDEEDEYAFTVKGTLETGKVAVSVGGVLVEMIIDSGLSNVIDKCLWENLKKKHIKCTSRRAIKRLYAYGSTTPLTVVETCAAEVNVVGKHVRTEFSAIEEKGEPLFGGKTAMELGVLKLQVPKQSVNSVTDHIARHRALFDDIGKLKDYQLKLHIDPQIQPVAQPVRRTAFSLRGKIEKKLEELLHEDIIEKVDGPTPWVNPVVVVPKANSEIRLCVDMRCANKAIIRERHPIPTIDEILQDMQEGGVLSKLDLKWGYHQIELGEETRSITTFVTHKGFVQIQEVNVRYQFSPREISASDSTSVAKL